MPDSVAMNGWMFMRVTMKPLMTPTARPAPSPPMSPGKSPIGDKIADTTLAHLPVCLDFKDGKLYPNDRPGLGVELDLDKLDFYRRDRASQSVAVTA